MLRNTILILSLISTGAETKTGNQEEFLINELNLVFILNFDNYLKHATFLPFLLGCNKYCK